MRAVADDDVDRAQVQRWRHQSRALLIARRLSLDEASAPFGCAGAFRAAFFQASGGALGLSAPLALVSVVCQALFQVADSGGAPPLPIPNREVKPARADGTASAGE